MANNDRQERFLRVVHDQDGSSFVLLRGRVPVSTPAGNSVTHRKRSFLLEMKAEMDGSEEPFDVQRLSRYSVFSTYVDFFASGERQMGIEEALSLVASDRTLNLQAGPEAANQLLYLGMIDDLLLSWDIKNRPMAAWSMYRSKTVHDRRSLESISRNLVQDLALLHPAQLAVVANVAMTYDSALLGLLLAQGRCSPFQFAMIVSALACTIPDTWDFPRKGYADGLRTISADASLLQDFISYTAPVDTIARERLLAKMPFFFLLPSDAQLSLVNATLRTGVEGAPDFTAAAILYGKAFEISLRQEVFEVFRIESSTTFMENSELTAKNARSKRVERVASYVFDEPHRIELGTMIVALENAKNYHKKEALLKPLFELATQRFAADLSSRGFIRDAKLVVDVRNRAAHAELIEEEEFSSVKTAVERCMVGLFGSKNADMM